MTVVLGWPLMIVVLGWPLIGVVLGWDLMAVVLGWELVTAVSLGVGDIGWLGLASSGVLAKVVLDIMPACTRLRLESSLLERRLMRTWSLTFWTRRDARSSRRQSPLSVNRGPPREE